ncbi:MAG: LemA family protein [Planctomycetes bacterium]|nr:LemA family protein [Planctomycetota bacterium]
MENTWVVVAIAVVVALGFPIILYNGLVRLRNHCRESWSDVDTELKRRHDLIPNLVEVVKGYAKHERELFERVASLRSQAMSGRNSPGELAAKENELMGAVGRLFALAEGYPSLKADEHFQRLMRELVLTEDRIQAARRFYNANVRDFNTRCEVFPSVILAKTFSFEAEEFFELSDVKERIAPAVGLGS